MAERDTTLVTVNLDRKRPYRINDTDRGVVWVGPGEVEIPAWVAEAWSQTPQGTPQPTNTSQGELRPPVTIETVTEQPMRTTETLQTVDADNAPVDPADMPVPRGLPAPAIPRRTKTKGKDKGDDGTDISPQVNWNSRVQK